MGELAVKIEGADENGFNVLVSKNGELLVRPLKYSNPYYVLVDTPDTAFEVVPAIASMRFVMTGILISTTKTFASATTAETITIYEANAADLSTNLRTIFKLDMLKNDRLPATGLNLQMANSRSLVAIGSDASVDVTIAGYYVGA